jgi:hypothetical protein
MGNVWTGTCDGRLTAAEEKIIGFSGVPRENFELSNVKLNDLEDGDYIRTIHLGKVCFLNQILKERRANFGISTWVWSIRTNLLQDLEATG